MERKEIYLLDNEELLGALKRQRMQNGKLMFGGMALVMIVLGFWVYLFSSILGIDTDTAEFIAIAFLGVGAFDYLILHFWDNIFDRIK